MSGFIDSLQIDNKAVRVFRNNSDDWTERLVNPRIDGDELVGNLHTATGVETRIKLEDIDMVDFRGTFKSEMPGAVDEIFSMPLSLSRTESQSYQNFTSLASDGATRSNDEINAVLREMNDMTRAESTRIASITNYKLANGLQPTELEFLATIKNSSGYITKENLPHLERFREVYNSGSTEEALAMIDDIYRGTNSDVTNLIKSNITMMTRRLGNVRAPQRQILIAAETTNDANTVRQNALDAPPRQLLLTEGTGSRAVVVRGNTVPRVIDDLLPPAVLDDVLPPPALLSRTDFPVAPLSAATRTAISTGGRNAMILSAAALTAAAITNSTPSQDSDYSGITEIIVTGRRRGESDLYSVTQTRTNGPPTVCKIGFLKKLPEPVNGEEYSDQLTPAQIAEDKLTIKWFNGTTEVCVNSNPCTIPDGAPSVIATIYIDNVEYNKQAACEKYNPSNPVNPDTDGPFNPYDTDETNGNGNGSDLDMASQFYEQQRSPPPSLFQAAPIPRRPTHYLHSGWY